MPRKGRLAKIRKVKIGLLLVVGLLVRVGLATYGTLELDQNTFVAWGERLVTAGFSKFYDGWCDYLPGYLYVLWGLAKVREVLPVSTEVLYKLPAIVADCVTGWVIYQIVKQGGRERRERKRRALIASAAYLFNPAVLSNSTWWGQIDSVTALCSLLAIWLVESNLTLSAVCLAVGTLIKPQAAFMVPVVAVYLFRKRVRARDWVIYGVVGLGVFVLGFAPFAAGTNLARLIWVRVSESLGQYPYTSVNAFNGWALRGMWESDGSGLISARMAGYVMSGIIAAGAIWKQRTIEKGRAKYLTASIILLGTFLFLTRMHERHLLPALAPLAVAAATNPVMTVAYGGLSVTYLLNMHYSYVWITQGFREVFPAGGIELIGMVNIFWLGWLFGGGKFKKGWAALKRRKQGEEKLFGEVKIAPARVRILMVLILGFSLGTRMWRLDSPGKEYFDEVYHAFTARIMLHGDPKAWEWWNPHPEGYAYEWTHPPLAKELMVVGMSSLGEKAIGWRAPAALAGVAAVGLVYLIAKELFDDYVVGVISAATFALDGLPLVMSRIGMNDIYFLIFMLLSLWWFLREKNFWAAMALGLAAASKWTVLWFLPLLGVAFLSLRKKVRASDLWFMVIPPLVYLLSYGPMFMTGHDWETFIGVQKQMWWYHTQLEATHPYTSMWWSWPLMLRPIWLYTQPDLWGGKVANIYAMGNPVVFWVGLTAIAYTIRLAFLKKSRKLGLMVFSYLIFFVPWAVSPRIMFLYHYLPSLPFAAMAVGVMLARHKRMIGPFFLTAGILFVYFYPHWIGLAVPVWLDKSYYWLSSWR